MDNNTAILEKLDFYINRNNSLIASDPSLYDEQFQHYMLALRVHKLVLRIIKDDPSYECSLEAGSRVFAQNSFLISANLEEGGQNLD